MEETANPIITTMQTTALLLRIHSLLLEYYFFEPKEGASTEYLDMHLLARDIDAFLYDTGTIEYRAFNPFN